jgi:protocatechuate 3,4-dioxygenase beta subunit
LPALRHRAALAPRSRVCRYTITDGDDRRVFTTLYPTRYGIPERGNVLDMLILPDQPERGIVADFYVREVTT